MNYIGLDISKTSTGMAINVNGKTKLFSYNNLGENYKWCKLVNDYVTIRYYEYVKSENYSDSEFEKLKVFSKISNDVIFNILSTVDKNDDTLIYIEGFNYSNSANNIIDLVAVAYLIRNKIFENLKNFKMVIKSPKSVKSDVAKFAYGTSIVLEGKRKVKEVEVINTNKNGVKGGDFDKRDMFYALEDAKIAHPLQKVYKDNYDEIVAMKTFPKPLEDIDDAIWLMILAQNS